MNDSGYVSLQSIAGFRKVMELSSKMEDILEALKDSKEVVVDAANLLIKPAITFERKTIILRDVPAETTEEEIRALFEGVGQIESLKMEFAGTWFVVMESEKVAIAALDVLRHRTLHDQSVKARLKNESYLKNLLKELAPSVDGIPAEFVVPAGMQPMMFMNYNGQAMMMPVLQPPMYGQSTSAAPVENRGGKKVRRDRKENRDHKKREHHPRTYSQPKVLPALQNAELFPPLVPTVAPTPVVIEKKYSAEDIRAIVKNMTDLSCPPVANNVDGVVGVVRGRDA